ncbi:resB-like family protein [Bordetella holmesii ATCC 51541]|nr:resB-like family protein [Bordetella holmesii ATCC 51541]
MRFAISLLMFICVVSLVGTVLPQNRPASSYVDQFGPFWYEVFDKFSIWHVYNSWWFLLIMGFLVVSTSICLIRNGPRMVRDALSFRDHVRQSSLRAFPERVQVSVAESPPVAQQWLLALLRRQGYAVRQRQDAGGPCWQQKRAAAIVWAISVRMRRSSLSVWAVCSIVSCPCACRSCSAASSRSRKIC